MAKQSQPAATSLVRLDAVHDALSQLVTTPLRPTRRAAGSAQLSLGEGRLARSTSTHSLLSTRGLYGPKLTDAQDTLALPKRRLSDSPSSCTTILPARWSSTISNSPMYPAHTPPL